MAASEVLLPFPLIEKSMGLAFQCLGLFNVEFNSIGSLIVSCHWLGIDKLEGVCIFCEIRLVAESDTTNITHNYFCKFKSKKKMGYFGVNT